MKNVLFISFVFVIFCSGCMTMAGGKQKLLIAEAPEDLQITYKGKPVVLKKSFLRDRIKTGPNTYMSTPSYSCQIIKIKLVKDTSVLELISGNKKVPMKIKTKPRVFDLIWDGILTLGISPLVDVLTKSHFHTKDYIIDVPAALNGSARRSNKELLKAIVEVQKKSRK